MGLNIFACLYSSFPFIPLSLSLLPPHIQGISSGHGPEWSQSHIWWLWLHGTALGLCRNGLQTQIISLHHSLWEVTHYSLTIVYIHYLIFHNWTLFIQLTKNFKLSNNCMWSFSSLFPFLSSHRICTLQYSITGDAILVASGSAQVGTKGLKLFPR